MWSIWCNHQASVIHRKHKRQCIRVLLVFLKVLNIRYREKEKNLYEDLDMANHVFSQLPISCITKQGLYPSCVSLFNSYYQLNTSFLGMSFVVSFACRVKYSKAKFFIKCSQKCQMFLILIKGFHFLFIFLKKSLLLKRCGHYIRTIIF